MFARLPARASPHRARRTGGPTRVGRLRRPWSRRRPPPQPMFRCITPRSGVGTPVRAPDQRLCRAAAPVAAPTSGRGRPPLSGDTAALFRPRPPQKLSERLGSQFGSAVAAPSSGCPAPAPSAHLWGCQCPSSDLWEKPRRHPSPRPRCPRAQGAAWAATNTPPRGDRLKRTDQRIFATIG